MMRKNAARVREVREIDGSIHMDWINETDDDADDTDDAHCRCTLDANDARDKFYLSQLAAEIMSENPEVFPPRLTGEGLERVFFARLTGGFEASSSSSADVEATDAYAWTVETYRRANDEYRRIAGKEDATSRATKEELGKCLEFCVSYGGMLLHPELAETFPQSEAAGSRGACKLLDAMRRGAGIPHGYLEKFAERFADEGLDAISEKVFDELRNATRGMSPLGEFDSHLKTMYQLVAVKAFAMELVKHKRWIPMKSHLNAINGRQFESESALGWFFRPSVLPDIWGSGEPEFINSYFSNLKTRTKRDVEASYAMLRGCTNRLTEGLYQILFVMLKHGGEVREGVLAWLEAILRVNAGRGKLQLHLQTLASHGSAHNLSAVALRLALPFIDPQTGKYDKISPAYVRSRACRLALADETRVAFTADEAAAAKLPATEDKEDWGFICECFYITGRALHLGYVKCIVELSNWARDMQDQQSNLRDFEAMRDQFAGSPEQARFERRLEQMKSDLEESQVRHVLFDCALREPRLISEALRYYRLVAVWLMRIVATNGDYEKGNGFMFSQVAADQFPESCPAAFATLPEYIVEDLVEFMLYVSRYAPDALEQEPLDEIMNFFITFMGNTSFVKNPYLRCKFVEVLRHWIPFEDGYQSQKLLSLFEVNPVSLKNLVPSLLYLYVDIEFSGGANQFYEKFNVRYQIGELCEYLWSVQAHKNAWIALAKEDPEFYTRFLNMLINDAIYLLDEAMKKLPEVRETENDMQDQAGWAARPQQERQERESAFRQTRRHLRSNLTLAMVHVRMMSYTSREIAHPFLRPEMVERVAAMLNYFLLFLAGPERRKLKIRNPEKYGWEPKELLGMITDVYVHIYTADKDKTFIASIAADGRSYRNEVMVEAASIARSLSLRSERVVATFESLAKDARDRASEDEEEEADLGDIPDEFLDPILSTLMRDPVLLPSGHSCDRSIITRHLLSDETDPFSRQPLTVDQLVANDDLRVKIEAWIAERKAQAKK